MIVKFVKNVGETMNELLERFKQEYKDEKIEKISYAGRLDPLAQGIVIIFTNEDVYKQESYVAKNKTYRFMLVHNIQTDTFDIMGLITNINNDKNEDVEEKEYIMKYPPFSSHYIKRHKEPLWKCTKNNLEVTEDEWPKQNIRVNKYVKLKEEEINGKQLYNLISERINKVVKQTFRQNEILEKWKNNINTEQIYTISHHEISLSKGGYVRAFANILNGCCYDIDRIKYDD